MQRSPKIAVQGLMALAIVATVNAEVTIGPRVYFAKAKNHALFPAAAKVHPRFHTRCSPF